ncbi:gamma-glutamyltransferase [Mesorhizobium loti]|uniref:gamma-glutamyltransferase n=1 Tax=Mesorhizobium sp. AA22 TaxID=1854057 RepID=UPI000AF988FF
MNGMAATSHPLATLAAVDILRDGGTAAVATLCVVEPANTGIGGDCYALISKPGKPAWGYNGSGLSGAKASYQALCDQGMREIGDSVHSVTVPGAIDAWEQTLKAHGRFGLDRVLRAAIQYAEGGFPVAQRVALDWQRNAGKLAACRGAAKHYLFKGMAPQEGDVIRFPALAETLKTIANKVQGVLRRRSGCRDGGYSCRPRLFPNRRGLRQSSRQYGRSNLDQLSWSRSCRDPAERAGTGRAGDA